MVARLSLLVGFGFAAGLLIGIVSEEPELLAGHLRGEGQSIVLAPSEGSASPADDEAAPPPAGGEPESAPQASQLAAAERGAQAVAERARAQTALPPVAAAPADRSDGAWSIQVGAFSDETAATRLTDDLRGKGYPVRLLAAGGESQRWRVRVQPIRGEAQANAMAGRLKRDERLPTWVLPLDERARR